MTTPTSEPQAALQPVPVKRRGLSFWRRIMIAFSVMMMLVSVVPIQPARADCNLDWLNIFVDIGDFFTDIYEKIKEIKWLWDIYDGLTTIYNAIMEWFGWLFDKMDTVTKIILEGKRLQIEILKRLKSFDIENTYKTRTILEPGMAYAMRHQQLPTHEACKKIYIHQRAKTTKGFKAAVKLAADEIVESMMRGPTDSSVSLAVNLQAFRCVYGFGNPLDGYPADCIDTTSGTDVGPAYRKLTDIDLSPYTLGGAIALEMPKMVSEIVEYGDKKITVSRPDPQNYNQKAWVGAVGYCIHMAEERAVPLWDKSTDKGMQDYALFKWGLSLQKRYNSDCTEQVAKNTRPSRNDPESSRLIAEQNKTCSILKEGDGAFTAKEIDEKFDGCKYGLTPYQHDLIEHMSCFGSNQYIAQAMALTPDYETMRGPVACMTAWNKWQENELDDFERLVDAAVGQQKVKAIWGQMSNSGGGKEVANQNVVPGVYTLVLEKRRKEAARKEQLRKAGIILPQDMTGTPTYADEGLLPVAVSQ